GAPLRRSAPTAPARRPPRSRARAAGRGPLQRPRDLVATMAATPAGPGAASRLADIVRSPRSPCRDERWRDAPPGMRVGASAELEHRPATISRNSPQLAIGVERARVPDGLEEGKVGVAVRIGGALHQVEALALGNRMH